MVATHIAAVTLAAAVTMSAGTEPANGILHGNVRDPQGAAVAGARVEVACGHDRRQSISGPNGEFSVSGLPLSRCIVTAHSALFDAASAEVDLSQGEATTSLVMPIPAFETSVTVTASRGIDEQTFRVPQPTSTTSREQIDARPYALLPQVLR